MKVSVIASFAIYTVAIAAPAGVSNGKAQPITGVIDFGTDKEATGSINFGGNGNGNGGIKFGGDGDFGGSGKGGVVNVIQPGQFNGQFFGDKSALDLQGLIGGIFGSVGLGGSGGKGGIGGIAGGIGGIGGGKGGLPGGIGGVPGGIGGVPGGIGGVPGGIGGVPGGIGGVPGGIGGGKGGIGGIGGIGGGKGGKGGLPGGLGSITGVLDGSREGFFAFRKATDLLSEKACDFALNDASRFADFFVLVPYQSVQELLTGWFEIGEAAIRRSANGFSEEEVQHVSDNVQLTKDVLRFIPNPDQKISKKGGKGTFEGVQPNEFFASNTYLRCRQLYENNPLDFIEVGEETPKPVRPTGPRPIAVDIVTPPAENKSATRA
ncbi:hypothetical protein TWF481_007322 [Arthrobotrys musiformis]|uniref:Uncharacterized protein n=1 Tax=Arthrobotrys musiformis TaxID=47236 RepID=A0AAV9WBZ5_9PEZI